MSHQQAATDWYGFDAEVGAPFARLTENGVTTRYETDGNGELRQVVEHASGPTLRERYELARRRLAKIKAQKHNAHLGLKQRRELVRSIVEARAEPTTTREIAEQAGLWFQQAECDLQWLYRQGQVTKGRAVEDSQSVTVWGTTDGA